VSAPRMQLEAWSVVVCTGEHVVYVSSRWARCSKGRECHTSSGAPASVNSSRQKEGGWHVCKQTAACSHRTLYPIPSQHVFVSDCAYPLWSCLQLIQHRPVGNPGAVQVRCCLSSPVPVRCPRAVLRVIWVTPAPHTAASGPWVGSCSLCVSPTAPPAAVGSHNSNGQHPRMPYHV
jgi:hypothetical protein